MRASKKLNGFTKVDLEANMRNAPKDHFSTQGQVGLCTAIRTVFYKFRFPGV